MVVPHGIRPRAFYRIRLPPTLARIKPSARIALPGPRRPGRSRHHVPVAEPPDRLDRRARPAVLAELAPQPHNAELDPFRADAERVVPCQVEQLVGGQRP